MESISTPLVSLQASAPAPSATSGISGTSGISAPSTADAAQISVFVAALLGFSTPQGDSPAVPLAGTPATDAAATAEDSDTQLEPVEHADPALVGGQPSGQVLAAPLQALPPSAPGLPAAGLASQAGRASVPMQTSVVPGKGSPAAESARSQATGVPLTGADSGLLDDARVQTPFVEAMRSAGVREAGIAIDGVTGPREATVSSAATPVNEPSTSSPALSRALEQIASATSGTARSQALPTAQPEAFTERLNHHISVMVSNQAQTARLAVNPAELGPVEVRVSVVGDEASIQLAAANSATRELLEDAMPRLRAAFSESGIALGNADVFTQMPGRDEGPQHDAQQGAAGNDLSDDDSAAENLPLRRVQLGLVDAFV